MTNRAVESATQMVGLMQRNWSGTTIPALGMAESCRFGKPVLQIWKASFADLESQFCSLGTPVLQFGNASVAPMENHTQVRERSKNALGCNVVSASVCDLVSNSWGKRGDW
jgi:hypothetical protein